MERAADIATSARSENERLAARLDGLDDAAWRTPGPGLPELRRPSGST